jgi:hypothetical protein
MLIYSASPSQRIILVRQLNKAFTFSTARNTLKHQKYDDRLQKVILFECLCQLLATKVLNLSFSQFLHFSNAMDEFVQLSSKIKKMCFKKHVNTIERKKEQTIF